MLLFRGFVDKFLPKSKELFICNGLEFSIISELFRRFEESPPDFLIPLLPPLLLEENRGVIGDLGRTEDSSLLYPAKTEAVELLKENNIK